MEIKIKKIKKHNIVELTRNLMPFCLVIMIMLIIIFFSVKMILDIVELKRKEAEFEEKINETKPIEVYEVFTPAERNELIKQIIDILKKESLNHDRIQEAIALCKCESECRNIRGKIDPEDYGIWQISMRYWEHEISREDAMNIEKSTIWVAQKLREQKGYLWHCWDDVQRLLK